MFSVRNFFTFRYRYKLTLTHFDKIVQKTSNQPFNNTFKMKKK